MFAKFCKHRGYEGLHDFCHVQKPHSEAYYTCHIIQYQKKGGTMGDTFNVNPRSFHVDF